jgi:hypothetical protein
MDSISIHKHHGLGTFAITAAPLLVAVFVAACTPKDSASGSADGAAPPAASASASPAEVAAVETVDPPAPAVAEDPEIPLNEAVVGSAPVADDYYATTAPPADVVEDAPPQPVAEAIWIPGYWWWSSPLARYVWVGGAWRNPPPDQVWVPGSWTLVGPDRYGWVPGFWGPRGFTREVIVTAPPVFRVEAYGAAPGAEFVWTPGYYAYRGGSYAWVVGSWLRPPVVGFGWVEPRYVGVWGHYYFQPGRWDHPAAARGTCYLPDIHVRPGEHVHPVAASVAVVSAHVGYVSASARAISHGAVRTASGGYAPGKPGERAGAAHGGVETHAGTEAHGATPGPQGVETHGEVHTGPEVHGAATEPHGATDVHGAATEPHGATEVHGAVHAPEAPHAAGKPEPHRAPPPAEKKKR